jgi:SAM-dependent methyltransferase
VNRIRETFRPNFRESSEQSSIERFLFLHLSSLPYFRGFLRAVESSYYQDLPLPSPVYDVGCGDGHFASLTFDHKLDVGLDPWRFSMREAKKYNAYKSLVEADGAQTPFPSESLRQRIEQLRARTHSAY